MANRKMSKVISVFAAFAMLALLVPTVAFASNTVSITDLSYNGETNIVTVTGEISSAGADITMMAIRSADELSAIPDGIVADDIMYIDQETVDESKTWTWNFKPRDTVSGSYITVFMSGTDVGTYVKDSVKLLQVVSAGEVVLVETDKEYYVNAAEVLDLSGMDADWLDAVEIDVYDGTVKAGSVDKTTGCLYLDQAPDEAEEYAIRFSEVEGFNDIDEVKVKVISADGATIAEYSGEAAWIDNNTESDNWTISIPAGNDDVTVTVTVDGVDETADVVNGVLTVARNAEGGAAKAVVVTAAAGNVSKTWPFTVLAKGEAPVAQAIKAEDVTILNSKAYGQTGKTLIAVTVGADVVNPETASMTVGDAKLYYSPDKGQYYGVVDGTLASDAAKAAKNIVIDPAVASEKLYFGVTGATSKPGVIDSTRVKFNVNDFYYAGRTTKGNENPTVKIYMAIDVNNEEPNGKFDVNDFYAMGRLTKGTALPVLAK